MNANLSAIQRDLGANSSNISELKDDIGELNGKTDAAIRSSNADIDELRSAIQIVQDDTRTVGELSHSLGKLEASEESRSKESNQKLAQLAERVAAIEGKLDLLISLIKDRVAP